MTSVARKMPEDKCALSDCGWERGASIHGDSGCGGHEFVEHDVGIYRMTNGWTTWRWFCAEHAKAHEAEGWKAERIADVDADCMDCYDIARSAQRP